MRFCFYVLISSVFLAASLSAQVPKQEKSITPKCGPLADQTLECPRFGFVYKVPFGWVDRTEEMQQEAVADQPTDQAPSGEAENPKPKTAAPDEPKQASSTSSETLLAVFERPPGAPGDTIDSAGVIAAEPLANYHGIKTAADYFGAIIELAEQRGFKVVNEPYAFSIGTKQLARGDFSKERGKLTMYQSSLVMIDKDHIVSFTFVGGSEDEVDDLIGNLTFARRKQVPQSSKAAPQ